jgi:hypothetical protein
MEEISWSGSRLLELDFVPSCEFPYLKGIRSWSIEVNLVVGRREIWKKDSQICCVVDSTEGGTPQPNITVAQNHTDEESVPRIEKRMNQPWID